VGFIDKEAIYTQIVEVDGVVLPALGELFQLLFVWSWCDWFLRPRAADLSSPAFEH
jgi:hypothetical protein